MTARCSRLRARPKVEISKLIYADTVAHVHTWGLYSLDSDTYDEITVTHGKSLQQISDIYIL